MERDRLLHVSGDRHLELTEAGRRKAMRVMRKHRLAERLLLDVIGLEWQFVHEEACRWEHVMSERVERKLYAMLGGVLESPYGNPIPGLDELGGPGAAAPGVREGLRALSDVVEATPVPARFVVRRLGETIQTDAELMARLADAGVVPGSGVSATRQGNTLSVRGDAGEVALSLVVAAHVFVVAEAATQVTLRG
jgi:DtxR family Mn-dependent transcriptional regulator